MAKGFNRPVGNKAPGGGGMMQQIQKMQEQMAEAQAKLADETVTVTVGGGAIKITMTGDQNCKAITIDPDMLKESDAEMLQDMLLSGINLALEKSRDLAAERMGPLTSGLSGMGLGF